MVAVEDRIPDGLRRVHLLGIAGTGMGAFAGLLAQGGYDVRGSDENVYPPMSTKLADWRIPVMTPYAPKNLDWDPELVVVGNVIRRDNVEATAVRERALAHASFPATLGKLVLDRRHSVVVAGTHGKTTTTTLIAHVLLSAGRDPGFLVGGIPQGLEESFRLGRDGGPFVVEGDEYDTAYFDKGPKFLHYRPRSLLCTSLEYDHADIYPSVEAIEARFTQLFALVPDGGHIVVRAGAPHLSRARAAATVRARVTTYADAGEVVAREIDDGPSGLAFDVVVSGVARGRVHVPLNGPHNVENALGAFAILDGLGLSFAEIAEGLRTFRGVKRRLEERGEAGGVLVVDDFAHHPTAIDVTLRGARARWPGRPLYAIFEPRSATACRKIFQDDFARCFDAADVVWLAPSGRKLDDDVALDVGRLARDVSARGIETTAFASIDAIVDAARGARAAAVLLCMSNGGFGGIHDRLLAALAARSGR